MSTVTVPNSSSHARRASRLGRYVAGDGSAREILGHPRPDGSVLVIDCLPGTLTGARLIARLAPEESPENARIVCDLYLSDETRGRCRLLTPEDLSTPGGAEPVPSLDPAVAMRMALRDAAGRIYCLRTVAAADAPSELYWTRARSRRAPFDLVTLRDVIAGVEDYEPASAITAAALADHRGEPYVSTHRLAAELERVTSSPIVLNRGLREAVQRTVASGELTLSEVAMRCGRAKRDRRGTLSGETSWLMRRIGAAPEGGEAEATPWIHTDTLARIARDGLGLNPNEVEL